MLLKFRNWLRRRHLLIKQNNHREVAAEIMISYFVASRLNRR